MTETTPWSETPDEIGSRPTDVPPDAVTLELNDRELLEAVLMYVGVKRGELFKGNGWLQLRSGPDVVIARVTYWRAAPSAQPDE